MFMRLHSMFRVYTLCRSSLPVTRLLPRVFHPRDACPMPRDDFKLLRAFPIAALPAGQSVSA
jgi:hypothetical protein